MSKVHRVLLGSFVAVALHSTPASAQGTDDWDYAADPATDYSSASVQYDGGRSIVVECRLGELRGALLGLPVTPLAKREFDAARSDGRTDHQAWTQEAAEAISTSSPPDRAARFLRGGGKFTLNSGSGEASALSVDFDIPSHFANLDKVLSDCGRPTSNPRDVLARATNHMSGVETGSYFFPKSRPGRPRDLYQADLSCIVGADGRLVECEVEKVRPESSNSRPYMDELAIRSAETHRVKSAEADKVRDTVLYLTITSNR